MSIGTGVLMKTRQAVILGPGRRFDGFYSEATNTDFLVGLLIGFTYGL